MHLTEIEFCERFNKLKLYNVAYIENYDKIFQHIGEGFSLRKIIKLR